MNCRFCWNPETSDQDPLILACKCRGSVGLIHFECLKSWIRTQKHTKECGVNVTSNYWKKFECEICKQSYPYIFKKKNQLFKLIDFAEPKEDTSFILLESMPLDKNTSRNIHMLTVTKDKTEFKLGRGHESEVRINDISVSRCHAIIKCKVDGFYIEDNLSKFGTIVLMKDRMRLAEDHTSAVQVGRSVVSFTIKNIDAREKLKREIEPLLSRNKNKQLSDGKPELPRSSSAEHHTKNEDDPTSNAPGSEFTVMPGSRPPREAGKSVNPISRGNQNNIRNGFEGSGQYQAELSAFSQINNQVQANYGIQAVVQPGAQNDSRSHITRVPSGHHQSALINTGNAAIQGHNNITNELQRREIQGE